MTDKLITRKFLDSFNFRIFNEGDYRMWAGVQSPAPMIAERDEYLVIIDGDHCEVYVEGYIMGAYDTCDNICGLSYD